MKGVFTCQFNLMRFPFDIPIFEAIYHFVFLNIYHIRSLGIHSLKALYFFLLRYMFLISLKRRKNVSRFCYRALMHTRREVLLQATMFKRFMIFQRYFTLKIPATYALNVLFKIFKHKIVFNSFILSLKISIPVSPSDTILPKRQKWSFSSL